MLSIENKVRLEDEYNIDYTYIIQDILMESIVKSEAKDAQEKCFKILIEMEHSFKNSRVNMRTY